MLYAASGLLLVLMSVAAFISPAGAWPLCAAAVACVFLANLDRFSELSASTSGVTATLREAQHRVSDLKKMIEVSSELQLSLLQQTGRWGSLNDEKKEYFLSSIVQLMRDAGVSEIKIDDVRREAWDRYVELDYADAVLGNSAVPDGADIQTIEEWKQLRRGKAATPEELRAFIEKIGDPDPERLRYLDAYEYYRTHRRHKDFELWKGRDGTKRMAAKKKT